ncbi:C4-dicarboxylate transport protein DctA (plasmid) [Cupriavidus necator N-1]|uniref:C4-dicarboxylate transport protein DctA n=1 Tax=Cupriavidus necator (strain ATCC 43291 / DSM 13513 / CCUG 52238 / LMG 8453 / N-1) TaxID=1042878 RepID=F8GUL1_CUPNN|nr:dicarboxylate/amino acid:cation symporter [Cupriavidus necator]AEI82415.1 C4-dicarboxylate transport protein DctA [Cupriavidus necator N-1]MDX6007424.1 dicarboxylate/amino acid:cation symporter [Cupriavidus necator]
MPTVDSAIPAGVPDERPHKKWYSHLYVQVLIAVAIGIIMGHIYPNAAQAMKPLGDNFLKLVKLMVAPLIFCTVVHGIASMRDIKAVGRLGGKALIYFEVMTTLALAIGLLVVNIMKPGVGMHVDPSTLDASSIATYTKAAHEQTVVGYLSHIIPHTVIGAFAEGDLLQVLFISIIFAFALQMLGERGKPMLDVIDSAANTFFNMVRIVMYVSPLGAFGAIAFTIGKYGIGSLASYGQLLVTYYLTAVLFVVIVLGAVCRLTGFGLFSFLRYIREELLIVLGTSSSESALPRLMAKLERLGCDKSAVGLVVPSGYSFNLDGSCINMTVLAIFIAQATDTYLSFGHQVTLLAILLLTSKGAASVSGGAFIVLAATLGSIPGFPVAGLVLVLGVYRFISEGGAIVNVIGNGIATIVVAKWEKLLDEEALHLELQRGPDFN